jgi:hypothetical protein
VSDTSMGPAVPPSCNGRAASLIQAGLRRVTALAAAALCGACGDPSGSEALKVTVGADQRVMVGTAVQLNASLTPMPSGRDVSYRWTLVAKPGASSAVLAGETTQAPTFVPDLAGTYRVRALVTMGSMGGADEVVIEAADLGGTIDQPTTFHFTGRRYALTSTLRVRAPVVVEPGVIIEMKEGYSIWVEENGSLTAIGTAMDSIRFVGAREAPGAQHLGIHFLPGSLPSRLGHVVVTYGGRTHPTLNSGASITIWGGGSVAITNSSLRSGLQYGIRVLPAGRILEFSRNSFSDLESGALSLHAEHVPLLDAESRYGAGSHVRISAGIAAVGGSWQALDVPYRVHGLVQLAAPVRIEPGARLEFASDAHLRIEPGGALSAVGTEIAPIRLLGLSEARGSWGGIAFLSASPQNQLEHVEIANGGGAPGVGVQAAVYVWYGATVSIRHTVVRGSAHIGLLVEPEGQLTGFERNTFRQNRLPVSLDVRHLGALDSESTYAGGNEDDRVFVGGVTVTSAATWPRTDGGYVVRSLLLGAAITIEAGARFEFHENGGLAIGAGGSLRAIGSAASPIVFTGTAAVPGHWGGVAVFSSSTDNLLEHVHVEYAGSTRMGNVSVHDAGSLTIRNSMLRHGAAYGLWKEESATVIEADNAFHMNSLGDRNYTPANAAMVSLCSGIKQSSTSTEEFNGLLATRSAGDK